MYGKSATSMHKKTSQSKGNVTLSLAGAALLISVLGLFTPNSNVLAGLLPANCSSVLSVNSGVNVYGTNGVDGIGAYEVWLSEGNTGTHAEFLDSLVGTKGANGYSGKDGKSAYQLWLDNGNVGTADDFIASLTGNQGVKGVDGLSAYELWLNVGNDGTLQQFLNSLVGANGANGSNGTNGSSGQSAYEIWRDNGHSGATTADFLNSLVGAQGPAGSPGPVGSTGPKGDNGVCMIGVGGYYASFWDQDSQTGSQPVNGMLIGYTGSANGISAVNDDGSASTPTAKGSWIKFDHAGTYNIAFSAQLSKTGGSAATVSIWLQKLNGSVSNLDYTNTNIGLANNNTESFAAWNFFVDVNAGDKIRLAWHTTDPAAIIEAKTPVSNGVSIPGIPSVIVTVNQVR